MKWQKFWTAFLVLVQKPKPFTYTRHIRILYRITGCIQGCVKHATLETELTATLRAFEIGTIFFFRGNIEEVSIVSRIELSDEDIDRIALESAQRNAFRDPIDIEQISIVAFHRPEEAFLPESRIQKDAMEFAHF